MKKLKKIRLSSELVLSTCEMKQVVGGSGAAICSNMSSQAICFSGFGCTDSFGNTGHCGWVNAWSKCVCVSAGGE